MSNKFQIVITASDKATATVRKVRDSIAQFTRPIRQVKSSVAALGKELGLERLAKSLKGVAGAASKVAAVVGVGSVAAIAAFTRQWAFAGAEMLRTIGIIGIGSHKFQTLTGAAVAFGLSADDMAGGLKTLGDTFENAMFGRDQGALMMMNRLGITMHKTKDGSVDTSRALYDVARAIHKVKSAQVQGVIARSFGVEQLLPMLQKGEAGIKEYERAVEKSGAVQSGPALEAARKFAYQINLAGLAVKGLGNSIMANLIPTFGPLLEDFTAWMTKNREAIASASVLKGVVVVLAAVIVGRLVLAIVSLVAPLALVIARITMLALTAIPSMLVGIAALCESAGLPALAAMFFRVGLAVDAMLGPIGWAIAALTALGFAIDWVMRKNEERRKQAAIFADQKIAAIDPGRAKQAMAFYQSKGWTRNQAAALVGHEAFESGLNPQQREIGGGPGQGLAQWGKRRQADFKEWSGGKDLAKASLQDQLEFSQFELTKGKEQRAGRWLKATKTIESASDAVFEYERPANRSSGPQRLALARRFYEQPDKAPAPGVPPMLAKRFYEQPGKAPAPAVPRALARDFYKAESGGAAPAPGDKKKDGLANQVAANSPGAQPPVHVIVDLKNVPRGTKAEVKDRRGGGSSEVRIDYSLADLSTP